MKYTLLLPKYDINHDNHHDSGWNEKYKGHNIILRSKTREKAIAEARKKIKAHHQNQFNSLDNLLNRTLTQLSLKNIKAKYPKKVFMEELDDTTPKPRKKVIPIDVPPMLIKDAPEADIPRMH